MSRTGISAVLPFVPVIMIMFLSTGDPLVWASEDAGRVTADGNGAEATEEFIGLPARDILWNLYLPTGEESTKRVLINPLFQIHAGSGSTGVDEAAYHAVVIDAETGCLDLPGIPFDNAGNQLEVPRTIPPVIEVIPPGGFTLDRDTENALLEGDWEAVGMSLSGVKTPLVTPVERILMGHVYLALDRVDESFQCFWASGSIYERERWAEFCHKLAYAHPENAIALYIQGDSLARLGKWDEAREILVRSLEIEPGFYLSVHAIGIVHAANREWSLAVVELTDLTLENPEWAAGFVTLGTLWVQRRAAEGALKAFGRALELKPNCSMALNGRACAQYGFGRWEAANYDFAAAGRRVSLPFLLGNIRALGIAAENCLNPDLEYSPKFRLSDFLDWDLLRELSADEAGLLRCITGDKLPDVITDEFMELLNEKLNDPTLLSECLDDLDLTPVSDEIALLRAEVESYEHAVPGSLSEEQMENVEKLNRKLIEFAYPYLIAQHEQRDPGMNTYSSGGCMDLDDDYYDKNFLEEWGDDAGQFVSGMGALAAGTFLTGGTALVVGGAAIVGGWAFGKGLEAIGRWQHQRAMQDSCYVTQESYYDGTWGNPMGNIWDDPLYDYTWDETSNQWNDPLYGSTWDNPMIDTSWDDQYIDPWDDFYGDSWADPTGNSWTDPLGNSFGDTYGTSWDDPLNDPVFDPFGNSYNNLLDDSWDDYSSDPWVDYSSDPWGLQTDPYEILINPFKDPINSYKWGSYYDGYDSDPIGGVSMDMRRAFVDVGVWTVVAPFSIVYPMQGPDENTETE